jgi:molybdenum cofactor cytidylyltransferase
VYLAQGAEGPYHACANLIAGLLLAAGSASRFGGRKLLQLLNGDLCVGALAVRSLLLAVDRTVAIVRPGDVEVARMLGREGAEVVLCANAADGMGSSLACGVRATAAADGWIVALADMPRVDPATIRALASLIAGGAQLAAPFFEGQRGHPVAFGARFRDDLLALSGDTGARALLTRHAAQLVRYETLDRGILLDIDTPQDLALLRK